MIGNNTTPGRRNHPKVTGINPAVIRPGNIPDPLARKVSEQIENRSATDRAAEVRLIHRGRDEVIDLTDFVENPNGHEISVLSFNVPDGQIVAIYKLALTYSDPMACMGRVVGWRIVVNDSTPQHIDSLTYHWRYNSMGSINEPIKIDPVYVQSGETFAIQISTQSIPGGVSNTHWTEHLTVMARVSGKLYKPASPALIGG